MASRLSTAAASPSCTPMCSNSPLWKDSNSMVALSVSISAKISPSSTASPTFLIHEATVPSSMVSLNRGILTIVTPSGMTLSADGAGSSEGSKTGASSVSGASAPSPDNRLLTSSPSSPMMASRVSTAAVWPSSTPICKR